MISEATLDELQRFAERGRIGGEVTLRCDMPYPEAESEVTLSWDCSEADGEQAVLEVEGIGRFAVPRVGRRRVQVGAAPLNARLTAGSDQAELVILPRIIIPRIDELHAPSNLVLGEPLRLDWRSVDAVSCRVRFFEGPRCVEVVADAAGEMQYRPEHMGELHIEIEATGRHAHLSAESVATRVALVQVVAPPVRITLPRAVSALLGDVAAIEWVVSGTSRVRIEALEREQVYPAPAVGCLLLEVGALSEQFRLVATGLDEREHVAMVRVTPRLLDVSLVPDELAFLSLAWE
ncbi:MAG: hypothetical protein KKG92_04975 [Gammaproteobacteria bacterium]|nr:hypothetical protein [Gammaproteobacteria bacterium]